MRKKMINWRSLSKCKRICLLLCLLFTLTITIGGTFSYIVTKTPTLINLFVNGLNPEGDLIIQKIVEHPFGDGYQVPDGLKFTFEVDLGTAYAGKNVKISENGVSGTKAVDDNGKLTLEVSPGARAAVYDVADETEVTVTEVNLASGFAPDASAKTLTIEKNKENILTFTNTYKPEKADTSSLSVSGTKTLEGRDWQEGDEFTFELSAWDGNAWNSLGTKTVTYDSSVVGFNQFDFTNEIQGFAFTSAGVYLFKIAEKEGTIGGINYNNLTAKFEITVHDANMNGTLEIQNVESYSGNTEVTTDQNGKTCVEVHFVNHYAPAGSAEALIKIKKIIDDQTGTGYSLSGFTFTLTDEHGQTIVSDPTDSNGDTSFKLVFEPEDAGKSFVYRVKEVNAGETISGIKYDETEYRIQIDVVDNLDGTVGVRVSEYQEETVTLQMSAESEITESEQPQEEIPETVQEPEAEIEPEPEVEAEPEPEAEIEPESETEPEPEAEIEPELETEPEPQLSEPVEVDLLMVSSSAVILQEEGTEEQLEPQAEKAPASAEYTLSFVNKNIYAPLSCETTFTACKTMNGRTLKAGEFSFFLYETNDKFELSDSEQPVQVKKNAEDGTIAFDEITYTHPGNYYYVMCEDTANPKKGVTYDETKYLITVEVWDNNGELQADVKMSDFNGVNADTLSFENEYQAVSVLVPITGKKTLQGKTLDDGEFYFQLFTANDRYEIQGNVLQTVKNEADGEFLFELRLESPGSYYYVIKEDASADAENVEYDDTLYQVKVNVSDNDEGSLVSEIFLSVDGQQVEEILFENIYTAPITEDEDEAEKSPEPETPESEEVKSDQATQSPGTPTGDSNAIGSYLALALFAAAALWLIMRRKKS